MTTIEDLRLQYFEDCKEIIADLQKIDTETDLIDQKVKLDTLVEKIAFLKHCSQNLPFLSPLVDVIEEGRMEVEQPQEEETEEIHSLNFEIAGPSTEEQESQNIEPEPSSEPLEVEGIGSEFVEQTLEDSVESEITQTDIKPVAELETSGVLTENEEAIEEIVAPETEQVVKEESQIFESLEASTEAMENVNTTPPQELDVEKENEQDDLIPTETNTQAQAHRNAKKIKLAHIKGLAGSVHSLFDDEELDTAPSASNNTVASKNVSETESYYTKPKERSHFKLDLNDRIAFTKILFDGSQSELNHTVNELNEFRNLEEAKDYLSQVYHNRDWKKVDEYAQRLWMLVENKFQ